MSHKSQKKILATKNTKKDKMEEENFRDLSCISLLNRT